MQRLASLMTIAMGVATAAPPEADRIATFTVNTYLDDADAWSSDIGLNVPVGSAGLRYERGGFSGDLWHREPGALLLAPGLHPVPLHSRMR